MSRPSSTDSRLAAWLEEGPTSGPDDALADALARVRSTGQRPGWLDLLTGDTMDTTWRARPVLTARLTFVLLIAMLVLALTAGAAIVGSQLNRGNGPSNGFNALPAVTMPRTACPAGTQLKSGDIATFAGTGGPDSSGDGGQATAAGMQPWNGIAVDAQGVVYVSDGTAIRRIARDGVITTFVTGLTAANGLAFDAAGDLYVADDLATIKKIDPNGNVMTVVGTGVGGSTGDEGPAVNAQIRASMIAVGPQGNLYLDDATNRYRVVDPAGIIHAFAGTGVRGYSGDSGPATPGDLRAPTMARSRRTLRGTCISATRATLASGRSTRRGRSPPWSGRQGSRMCPRSWRSMGTGPCTSPTGGPTSSRSSTRRGRWVGSRGVVRAGLPVWRRAIAVRPSARR